MTNLGLGQSSQLANGATVFGSSTNEWGARDGYSNRNWPLIFVCGCIAVVLFAVKRDRSNAT